MSASEIERTLVRLAHEIVEKNNGVDDLTLVGIKRRGVPLAARLGKLIHQIEKRPVAVGTLDITLYRDDLSTVGASPVIQKTTPLGVEIVNQNVILVDDVLYTGRTVRAALTALADLGRPDSIQLMVLVDRGEQEVPIHADFVGKNVTAPRGQRVYVRLTEVDGIDSVVVGGGKA